MIRIGVFVSIGMAWAWAAALANLPAAKDSVTNGVSSAALVMPQDGVVAATSANPPAAAFLQWILGDVTRTGALVAWFAVAMLLVLIYECARN